MAENPRIVIIGAGASGIAAACRLYDAGLTNITILEAKDRIGGRIFTTEFGDNVVDVGAQWVHGETDNAVYNLVKSFKLLESSHKINDSAKHVFADSTGEIVPQSESSKIWDLYYAISDLDEEDLKDYRISYGNYFEKRFYRYFRENPFTSESRAAQFLTWLGKFDNSIQSSHTWHEVSALRLRDYKHCEGDPVLNWKDKGYKTILDVLMRKYPDESNAIPIIDCVKFNSEVATIDYSDPKNIIIKTKSNRTFRADNVIFTASLGVLKAYHATIFKPHLPPPKLSAINYFNIGTVNKIFLEFPHRWWDEEVASFELLWPDAEITRYLHSEPCKNWWLLHVFGFFTVDYQPRVLCGWVTSHGAQYMENLSDSEVQSKLFYLLNRFLGKKYDIPSPDRMLRSNWHSDKHFHGAYSFRSMKTQSYNIKTSDLSDPVCTGEDNDRKPTILFAGEATHEHYYSTVHGAVETGWREANRLIEYYGKLDSHL